MPDEPTAPPLESGYLPAGPFVDKLVDGTLEAVATWPAGRCPHRLARLVCSAHFRIGPLCVDCSVAHHATHSLKLDHTCDQCAELAVDVSKCWAPIGRYKALIKLCGECRSGTERDDDEGTS